MKNSTTFSPKDWTLKAVQMDLARQIEPLDRVLEFFDLAQRCGFNAVVLYLEDRIRTESYPYAAPGEFYTTDEIHRMVDYAAGKGLELIPVVSNLGHTERFLAHPELAQLSELRGEIAGRFSKAGSGFHNAVCPSLEESYAFFDRYLAEVAALFPSSYFHVGLDEVWDMGYCPLCRARMEAGEEMGDLFVAHILRTHRLLRSLGKTMVMWDDLFEHFPEKLEQLPRDIVMCCWNYQWVGDKLQGHFANSVQEDLFRRYDQLGFSYIAATHSDPYNVESYTQYAQGYHPLGGLLTIWERETRQLAELYPLVANGGMLWNGVCPDDPQRRMKLALAQELESDQLPESLLDALAAAALFPSGRLAAQMSPVAPFTQVRAQRENTGGYLLRQLDRELSELKQNGPALSRQAWDIVQEYRGKLQDALLVIRLNRLYNQLLDHRSGVRAADTAALADAFGDCARQVAAERDRQLELWNRRRTGLAHTRLDLLFERQLTELARAEEQARSAAFGEIGRLNLRFFLPDGFGAERTAFTLLYADGTEEEQLAEGVFKSPDFSAANSPYYTLSFPLPAGRKVAGLRIEAWGYGGIGFTWLETEQGSSRRIPAAIRREEGRVENACHLLMDDSRWCYLGEPYINLAFRYGQLSQVRHTMEVELTDEL